LPGVLGKPSSNAGFSAPAFFQASLLGFSESGLREKEYCHLLAGRVNLVLLTAIQVQFLRLSTWKKVTYLPFDASKRFHHHLNKPSLFHG
jgi:hypothetical protein